MAPLTDLRWIFESYLFWLVGWACNRMILGWMGWDGWMVIKVRRQSKSTFGVNKLITFACQVLEYQPEPANQWTTVGQLEAERQAHAVLSIGSEGLPCLQGCLIQDDLFVDLQLLSSRLSLPLTFFIIIILLVRRCHYMPLLYGEKLSLTNIRIWRSWSYHYM